MVAREVGPGGGGGGFSERMCMLHTLIPTKYDSTLRSCHVSRTNYLPFGGPRTVVHYLICFFYDSIITLEMYNWVHFICDNCVSLMFTPPSSRSNHFTIQLIRSHTQLPLILPPCSKSKRHSHHILMQWCVSQMCAYPLFSCRTQ